MTGIELTIELDESLYRALRLRAAREQAAPAEAVNHILSAALQNELTLARGEPPLASVIRYVAADRHNGRGNGHGAAAAFHYS